MILLHSGTDHNELRYMANITIRYGEHYWKIQKHRYVVDFDEDRFYSMHSLQNYINEFRYSNIYGTPESYGKQVIVTILQETDVVWMCTSSAMYQVADIVLVEHRVGKARYYSVMKNVYNPFMEMRSYDREYINNLINVYQRRPY
jgi:hypothetical protein